jgi:Tfp pilus assembly protein PilO
MPLYGKHKMKNLSPAKKKNLALAILGTVASVCLVYFFLISPQHEQNAKLASEAKSKQAQLEQIKKSIKQAEATAVRAAEISAQLGQMETDMASGDVFAWTYDTVRRFKSGYRLDIPTISQPISTEVELIPGFPYKQIKFSLSGTGYYHDIGKFIADLENQFPHMRAANVMLETTFGPDTAPEKLSFQVEIVALVKPNS